MHFNKFLNLMKKQNHCSVMFFLQKKKTSILWLKSIMYWSNSSLTIFYNVCLRFLSDNIQFPSIWYVRGIENSHSESDNVLIPQSTPPEELSTLVLPALCPKRPTCTDRISEFHMPMWYNPSQKDKTRFNFEKQSQNLD